MSSDPRRRAAPPPRPPTPPPPPAEPDTNINSLDGASDTPPQPSIPSLPLQPIAAPSDQPSDGAGFKLRFCTVCASNNNRSMEAHLRLTTRPTSPTHTYPTLSFGTGSLVRLPGPSIQQPNVYSFNSTSYSAMYDELRGKDSRLYTHNGILNMLERNKGIKYGPERWQDWAPGVPRVGKRKRGPDQEAASAEYSDDKGAQGVEAGTVDIVITCEERCWDAVVEDLLSRGSPLNRPVHVFNVDIRDNHEEALVGGKAILELADALNAAANEEREKVV
ncbi:RNA polymerase II subunit A C-terminal domain phosphatase, partial [Teratosphaeriaceae sp. CCFEE 6253]